MPHCLDRTLSPSGTSTIEKIVHVILRAFFCRSAQDPQGDPDGRRDCGRAQPDDPDVLGGGEPAAQVSVATKVAFAGTVPIQ